MLILAENTEIMHLISTLISKNTSKTMHMQQTSTRQKQLPYLHHCAHVWSVGHDGCDSKQTKIDFVT